MRVAVTGAGGRLGTALVRQLEREPFVGRVLAWDLPEHDLDDPASAVGLVSRHRPDAVIHAAAWTDVDGCAAQPAVALRRNGTAAGEMAEACAASGAALILVSTNEVFDGLRTDGMPYLPTDSPHPPNPYGASKLAGEQGARAAFAATDDAFAAAALGPPAARKHSVAALARPSAREQPAPALARPSAREQPAPALAIVRTAWLFGLPGVDYPQKILVAARKAEAAGTALKLVADEIGCPTYATDLAAAIVGLMRESSRPGGHGFGGIHHVVNAGPASRAEWAREVLRLAGIVVPTEEVPMSTWPRPSTPPTWGVLGPTPLPDGPLRAWQDALAEYFATLPRGD